MRTFLPATLATAVLMLAATGPATAHGAKHKAVAPLATVKIADPAGATIGTGKVLGAAAGSEHVRLWLEVAGLTPGVHGIHLHAVGTCTAPDFKSAGGHLNPDMHMHGMLNPKGPHLGDLPNLTADASGKATTTIELPITAATLDTTLFDTDGTALVIHAGPDDYKTDPAGNSGGRVACGVFVKG
jgi:Cu-Zn family superoxide dismutase